MDALLDEATMAVPDPPHSELTLKEPQEYTSEDTSTNFGINIVGGDVSDENEFPYYGTLPVCLVRDQTFDKILH